MPTDFEVIVVGGGLAGLTADYALAREGVAVLVVERGERPGAKNLFGGALHTGFWLSHFPELRRGMPLERRVDRHCYLLHASAGLTTLQWASAGEDTEPQSHTILRAPFDRWLGQEAAKAGARLLPGALVREVVYEKGRLRGVRVDRAQGIISARAVLLAEGVNGGLAASLSLGADLRPEVLGLGIKQVLALPEKVIDERFQGRGGQGSAYFFLGSCVESPLGGGFLYTNRESLCVGIVLPLAALSRSPWPAPAILSRFLDSPPVRDLLVGAEVREYGAHLMPQGATASPGSLVGPGVLVAGDAAGLLLNTGFQVRGGDLAAASGLAAARTLLEARRRDDYSRRALAVYKKHLAQLVGNNMRERIVQAGRLLKNPRLYRQHPQFFCQVMGQLCGTGPTGEARLRTILNQAMRHGGPGWLRSMRDLLSWVRRI